MYLARGFWNSVKLKLGMYPLGRVIKKGWGVCMCVQLQLAPTFICHSSIV